MNVLFLSIYNFDKKEGLCNGSTRFPIALDPFPVTLLSHEIYSETRKNCYEP